MTFLLQILYACYKELDEKFVKGQIKQIPKHQQVENILLNSYVPISKADLVCSGKLKLDTEGVEIGHCILRCVTPPLWFLLFHGGGVFSCFDTLTIYSFADFCYLFQKKR